MSRTNNNEKHFTFEWIIYCFLLFFEEKQKSNEVLHFKNISNRRLLKVWPSNSIQHRIHLFSRGPALIDSQMPDLIRPKVSFWATPWATMAHKKRPHYHTPGGDVRCGLMNNEIFECMSNRGNRKKYRNCSIEEFLNIVCVRRTSIFFDVESCRW